MVDPDEQAKGELVVVTGMTGAGRSTAAKELEDLGVAHGGIVDAHYGSGVSFRDPDGIALEFFAPPS